jgi:hypothetical protein
MLRTALDHSNGDRPLAQEPAAARQLVEDPKWGPGVTVKGAPVVGVRAG